MNYLAPGRVKKKWNERGAYVSTDEREFHTARSEIAGQPAAVPNRAAVSLKPERDPLLDTMLAGRYHILDVVGQGGMGVVYKARQELLDRPVAIKMLRAQFITDEISIKRFLHEARAAGRLNHPHVITVYDFGVSDSGEPYIVMEYISGISLADVAGKGKAVPFNRALGIFGQVCDALDHAHSQSMIHRDLKPGNIMLLNSSTQQDYVKVVDFGIAKIVGTTPSESQRLTLTGEIFGSPVYMSPEQCRGEDLGPASDIYSLGIVMYETLMGKPPFMGTNIVETITQHLCATPAPFAQVRPDIDIPQGIEAMVMKCLRKDCSLRYGSMAEVMYDIMKVAGPSMGTRLSTQLTRELQVPQRFRDSGDNTNAAAEKESHPDVLKDRQPSAAPAGEHGNLAGQRAKAATPPSQAQSFDIPPIRTHSAERERAYPASSSPRSSARSAGNRYALEPQPSAPSQSPIVWILASSLAVCLLIMGAVSWSFFSGQFNKPTSTRTAPQPVTMPIDGAKRQAVTPSTQHIPAVQPIQHKPANLPGNPPLSSAAHGIGASRTSDNGSAVAPGAATIRHTQAVAPHKRPVHVTNEPVRAPVQAHSAAATRQPTSAGTGSAPPHHYGFTDDYSRWSDFRQLERGQLK
jgi:serine/threonine protein kinase